MTQKATFGAGCFWGVEAAFRQIPGVIATAVGYDIFYNDEAQKELAERFKELMSQSGRFKRPVVSEIVPATTFYRAEDYHQQYLERRGLASCHIG